MAMTPLTGMPARTQEQSTFNTNANDFFSTKLPLFVTEANALQVDVDAKKTLAEAAATTATTQAGNATTQAGIATTQATLAQDWATKTSSAVSGGEFSAKYHAQAAAVSAASAVNSPGTQATSITSMTINNVSQSFMLQQTGKAFTVGQWVNITDAANPSVNWMAGAITSFISGTGAITVNVVMSGGAGTLSNWVVTGASAFVQTPAFGGRSARTSNTVLAGSDLGKLIDITSGTFTQTFTAAATLGGNWFCHIRNSGPGDITLDPNGSELIDGLTSYIMYPGETRLVMCDGAGFYSIVMRPYYRVFTSSSTWLKPPGYSAHAGLLWGGGGGGAKASGGWSAGGGGGGSCAPFLYSSSVLNTSESVVIGAGGAYTNTVDNAGSAGGATTFSTACAYGGGAGAGYSSVHANGGGGGGVLGVGSQGQPKSGAAQGGYPSVTPTNGATIDNAGFGGGSAFDGFPGNSVYGGGSGGGDSVGVLGLHAGSSVYGAGGGSGLGQGGSSVYGGTGGTGRNGGALNATAPTAPGGGGGSISTGGTGTPTDGARGELRIWGVL